MTQVKYTDKNAKLLDSDMKLHRNVSFVQNVNRKTFGNTSMVVFVYEYRTPSSVRIAGILQEGLARPIVSMR